jgi:hypothetical protein
MAKKTKRANGSVKRTRRVWTKADIRELKGHSKRRTALSKIAQAAKRTEPALRQMAFKLGIPLGHQR